MPDTREIERVRARIQDQRTRLSRGATVEVAEAEPVPGTNGRSLAGRMKRQSGGFSIGRVVSEHPALVIGLGAAILVAGPRRSLALARRAVRGGLFALAAYRSATRVARQMSSSGRGGRYGH